MRVGQARCCSRSPRRTAIEAFDGGALGSRGIDVGQRDNGREQRGAIRAGGEVNVFSRVCRAGAEVNGEAVGRERGRPKVYLRTFAEALWSSEGPEDTSGLQRIDGITSMSIALPG
jgi:hypothetical protein